jgi:hypothetical protein
MVKVTKKEWYEVYEALQEKAKKLAKTRLKSAREWGEAGFLSPCGSPYVDLNKYDPEFHFSYPGCLGPKFKTVHCICGFTRPYGRGFQYFLDTHIPNDDLSNCRE